MAAQAAYRVLGRHSDSVSLLPVFAVVDGTSEFRVSVHMALSHDVSGRARKRGMRERKLRACQQV